VGVTFPVGKISSSQMRRLAQIAQEMGDGDIRLTVWQNLLISGVPEARIAAVEAALADAGLSARATPIRAGLIACTGNRGCRFAASDTKGHAEAIAAYLEPRITMDGPINTHLTGCPNSCAQHYIGDIGLIGARVAVSDEGDTVEGYHLHAGGGFGPDAMIGREIMRDVKAEDAPKIIERLLRYYLRNRQSPSETFLSFTRRCETAELQAAAQNEVADD
jgi:ferredoxin-nitrite reductase